MKKKSIHQWVVAFDDPGSSRTIGRFLASTGDLDGNEETKLMCPDGKERHAFWVKSEVVKAAKDMTVAFDKKQTPVEYLVLHRTGAKGKLQTWPPGSSGWVNRTKREELPPPRTKPPVPYPPPIPDDVPFPL